ARVFIEMCRVLVGADHDIDAVAFDQIEEQSTAEVPKGRRCLELIRAALEVCAVRQGSVRLDCGVVAVHAVVLVSSMQRGNWAGRYDADGLRGERDIEASQAAKKQLRLPARALFEQLHAPKALQQGGERDLRFEARQRRTEAEVDAVAERQM